MGRKTKTTTQFGAKFGSSLRKKYTKATTNLRQKRNCPECNSIKFKRIAIGIWACDKCGYKVADSAYETTTV